MWARLLDNRVIELTPHDPAGRYHPDLCWIEAGEDTEIGMVHDGDGFRRPPAAPENAPAAGTGAAPGTAAHDIAAMVLVGRLNAAGRLRAVRAELKLGQPDDALTDEELFLREWWATATAFQADDPRLRALLERAGLDGPGVDALLAAA